MKDPSLTLRRRSNRKNSNETHELREHLIPKRGSSAYELSGPYVSPPRRAVPLDVAADENTFRRRSTRLIDLDTDLPTSIQDAEVREIIFNNPSDRPSTPHYPFPGTANLRQSSQTQAGAEGSTKPVPESTTYSFLSLSQSSSPEVSQSMLGSWITPTTSTSAVAGMAVPPSSPQTLRSPDLPRVSLRSPFEDDVMSISSSGMSGYEDAETYSPGASRVMGQSAIPAFPASETVPSGASQSENGSRNDNEGRGDALGLSNPVDSLGMAWVEARSSLSGMRSPMSVLSLTESEGWRSDEWEVTSER